MILCWKHIYESDNFNAVAGLLTNVKMLEDLDISTWIRLTNKLIYQTFASKFPKTKVEREASVDMSLVWKRLQLLSYNREVQETSLLMVHKKLPTQERLFRINLSRDPYCIACSGAQFQDSEHFFMKCDCIENLWSWTKGLCQGLFGSSNLDEEALLKFNWPKSKHDRSIS